MLTKVTYQALKKAGLSKGGKIEPDVNNMLI